MADTMKTADNKAAKLQRLDDVNKVIKAISSHGRRFFHYGGSNVYDDATKTATFIPADRTGYLALRRGRVYLIDEYSEKAVYTHETKNVPNRWRGFTHGGTLRRLVEEFRDYILTGQPLHPGYIGLEREWQDGDIWGYGKEAIAAVNADIKDSPVFREAKEQAA
jgi:hypothetical protein